MKLKVLLDTSVISAYFDERQPERMALTRDFWKNIKNYQVYISKITHEEVSCITDNILYNYPTIDIATPAELL